MAKENRGWGYDRIAGALAELGYDISDQTVGNILKRRGIPTAPERKKTTTWREFIWSHMDVLWATDFFSTEVWTLSGTERPHQGKGNVILFPSAQAEASSDSPIECRERLGELLKYLEAVVKPSRAPGEQGARRRKTGVYELYMRILSR